MSDVPIEENSAPEKQTGVGQGLALFCICMIAMLSLGAVAQSISFVWGLIFTMLVVILLPAIVFLKLKGVTLKEGLRFRRVSLLTCVLSLLVGMGTWSAGSCVQLLINAILGPGLTPQFSMAGANDYFVFLFIAALMPGICEEALFRGALQGVFERKGQWTAILLAAILFGIFHIDPWRIIPAALLGAVFGWLVYRTQSIIPGMLAHFANNTIAFTVGFFVKDEQLVFQFIWPALFVLLIIALLLFARLTKRTDSTDEYPTQQQNPLAYVGASLHPALTWLSGIFIAGTTSLVCSGYLFIASILTFVVVEDDALLPHIKKGDQLIIGKKESGLFDPEPGSTIAYKQGDKTVARVVAEIKEDSIIVNDGEEQIEIDQEDLVGTMIQVMPKE